MKKKRRWIQQALKKHKPRSLHRQLGIPKDEVIPIAVLRKATKSKSQLLARRARLALTLRRLRSKKRYG